MYEIKSEYTIHQFNYLKTRVHWAALKFTAPHNLETWNEYLHSTQMSRNVIWINQEGIISDEMPIFEVYYFWLKIS